MKKRNKMYVMIGLAVTILVLVGTSYAWWTSTATQTGINEVQSSCIKVALQDEQNNITLQNAYPLTDEQAKDLTPYQFTITNTCNTIVDYTVKLEKLLPTDGKEEDLLKSDYIAVEFNGGQKELLSNYPQGNKTYDGKDYTSQEARELIKGTLTGEEERTYTIKLWMDESVEATEESMNKSFISKIVVDGSINELAVYNEPKLHGADPVLGNEGSKEEVAMLSTLAEEEPTTNDKLIPVIISDNGTVTRANLAHEWYNYEEKKWANAVILVDGTKEPDVGEEIPETSIESYFVWIPKYKYKIFDMGHYDKLETEEELPDKGPNTAIEIIFGNTDTTNTGTTNGESECESPKTSGADGSCDVGKWMTHPAFLAFEGTTGLWVGKFETGYNQNGDNSLTNTEKWSKTGAEKDTNEPTKVIIKPNVYSWRNISVGNAFKTSLAYKEELQSHMLKNTEWGAVAYLTQSIYGRCDNENGTIKCEEVTINGNDSYITGTTNSDTMYISGSSIGASTTENYTGIYDMSGGAWDKTASVMLNEDGIKKMYGKSGLTDTDFDDSRFYDVYSYSTTQVRWERRILGDATGEVGPFREMNSNPINSWYKDFAFFIYSSYPSLTRGGRFVHGENAGIFAFSRGDGAGSDLDGFRIVLAP